MTLPPPQFTEPTQNTDWSVWTTQWPTIQGAACYQVFLDGVAIGIVKAVAAPVQTFQIAVEADRTHTLNVRAGDSKAKVGSEAGWGPLGTKLTWSVPAVPNMQGPPGPTGATGVTGATGTQGTQGLPGPRGGVGGNTLSFNYVPLTGDTDPGIWNFHFSSSAADGSNGVCISRIDRTDTDVTDWLISLGQSTTAGNHGQLMFSTYDTPWGNQDIFKITAPPVDRGAYFWVPVQFIAGHHIDQTPNRHTAISFTRTGDKG